MFSRLFSSKPQSNKESEQAVTAGRSLSPSTESASVSASAATGAPGSPTRIPLPPSRSPSPVLDPAAFHSLVTTCPPKTLYAYTLSRLQLGKNFYSQFFFQLILKPVVQQHLQSCVPFQRSSGLLSRPRVCIVYAATKVILRSTTTTAAAQCHMMTRAQKSSMWGTLGARRQAHMRHGGSAVVRPLKAMVTWVHQAAGVTRGSILCVIAFESITPWPGVNYVCFWVPDGSQTCTIPE